MADPLKDFQKYWVGDKILSTSKTSLKKLQSNADKLVKFRKTLKKGSKEHVAVTEQLETITGIQPSIEIANSPEAKAPSPKAAAKAPSPKAAVKAPSPKAAAKAPSSKATAGKKKVSSNAELTPGVLVSSLSNDSSPPPPTFRPTIQHGPSASSPLPKPKVGLRRNPPSLAASLLTALPPPAATKKAKSASNESTSPGTRKKRAEAAATRRRHAAPTAEARDLVAALASGPVKGVKVPTGASASASASAAPKKVVVMPAPKKASPPPPPKKAAAPALTPAQQRDADLATIRRRLVRALPRPPPRRRSRHGSPARSGLSGRSGSSASPDPTLSYNEFPDVLVAPHPHPEPVTAGHCGHLDAAWVDDWMTAARAMLPPGAKQTMPQYGFSFRIFGINDRYTRTDNSADGTCLIHSFLTAISGVYRNASNKNKGVLGRAFRQKVYAKLYNDREKINIPEEDYGHAGPSGAEVHQRLGARLIRTPEGNEYRVPARKYIEYVGAVDTGSVHGYLYDSDVKKLHQCFRVNILLITPQVMDIRYFKNEALANNAPGVIDLPNLILYQAGSHFTTIHLDDQYIFSYDDIRPILDGVNAARNRDKIVLSSADKIRYAANKIVFLKSDKKAEPTPYVIVSYIWDRSTRPSSGLVKRVTHVNLNNGSEVAIEDIRFL